VITPFLLGIRPHLQCSSPFGLTPPPFDYSSLRPRSSIWYFSERFRAWIDLSPPRPPCGPQGFFSMTPNFPRISEQRLPLMASPCDSRVSDSTIRQPKINFLYRFPSKTPFLSNLSSLERSFRRPSSSIPRGPPEQGIGVPLPFCNLFGKLWSFFMPICY